jgi:Ca2+-binding RTX toxin-like protein
LNGTFGNDLITGYAGADTLRGCQGGDQFIYTNFRDAGDVIVDFELGQDKLVLTQLLRSLNYNGATAIADSYVRLVQRNTGTSVQIDVDGAQGSGIFRPFITSSRFKIPLQVK